MLVVNPWDWLTPNGEIPTDNMRLRRRLIPVLRVIEYGAKLIPGTSRETLIECRRRPGGTRCTGLLHVERGKDDALIAYCPECEADEMLVHDWQGTKWAS